MMNNQTIRDVLEKLDRGEYLGEGGVDQAIDQIKKIIEEEVLTDDEAYTLQEKDGKNEDTDIIINSYMKNSRNKLRAEQREILRKEGLDATE